MSRKAKYSKETKIQACKDYLSGKESAITLSSKIGINRNTIYRWLAIYNEQGESGFNHSSRNRKYSKELKKKAILDYLNGEGSLITISAKYNIKSISILQNWIIKYNNGIETKDYDPKSEVYTMRARKVSYEEKLEIIQYVLDNDKDYKGAAEKYSVRYATIYNWVKKYLEEGADGLKDKRGRPRVKVEPLTELERLQLELEKKDNEIARLNRAIEALKKNEEIQERLEKESQKLGISQNTKQSRNLVKTKNSTLKN